MFGLWASLEVRVSGCVGKWRGGGLHVCSEVGFEDDGFVFDGAFGGGCGVVRGVFCLIRLGRKFAHSILLMAKAVKAMIECCFCGGARRC